MRQAVLAATSGDTVTFALSPACSIITLTRTISIATDLTIEGPGVNSLGVSGNNAVEVFNIASSASVTIAGLTIEYGQSGSGNGGGILNQGTLTLKASTLMDNSSYSGLGGALYNDYGTVDITDSTLSSNSATNGGAVGNVGTLSLTDSTLSNNTAPGNGGAIIEQFGTMTITNSMLSDNSATLVGSVGGAIISGGTGTALNLRNSILSGNSATDGGGIAGFGGGMMNTVTNSTLSNNKATNGDGGGIANGIGNYGGGPMIITNSTLSGNSANEGGAIWNSVGSNRAPMTITNSTLSNNAAGTGGGIWNNATLNMAATIVANSSASGGDCSPSVGLTDLGYNLADDNTCGFSGSSFSGKASGLDRAGPQNNGGPTPTIALLRRSIAIDHVPASHCPGTDQRGASRTPPCDVGAYDTDGNPTITMVMPAKGEVGTKVAITGTHLLGATAGAFNGTPAIIMRDTPSKITTRVPPGASTGLISITTSVGGTATSLKAFKVT